MSLLMVIYIEMYIIYIYQAIRLQVCYLISLFANLPTSSNCLVSSNIYLPSDKVASMLSNTFIC